MIRERAGGILLHLTSLPGPYGTGTLGGEALALPRRLADAGIRCWQMLPLNPPQDGYSPYMSRSSFAGHPMLIDPDVLSEMVPLTQQERDSQRLEGDAARFPEAAALREQLLRTAWSRAPGPVRTRVADTLAAGGWLREHALYSAVRAAEGDHPWWTWRDPGLRRHEPAALARAERDLAEEISYHAFVQMVFEHQWQALRRAAREAQVLLWGDLPVYVARDSADVWAHQHLFELDAHHHPERVAGVPPDAFTDDGQLWGNPLYRWDVMKEDGYAWWTDRVSRALSQFEMLRIDHFRGFESYWAVPACSATAREGRWEKGPGMDLFDRIRARFPEARIIAEDLGVTTDSTRRFLEQTGYPGMRVLQFGFDGNPMNEHLPHRYPFHCAAYIGTHDNATLAGWLASVSAPERDRILAYCRAPSARPGDISRAMVETLWSSTADLAVVSPQDLLMLDNTRRMNTPGTVTGNWRFRITREELDAVDWAQLKTLGQRYGRFPG